MDQKPIDLSGIIESARRFGIEMDESEAQSWVDGIRLAPKGDEIQLDHRSGVFGHKVVMLDFSDTELAYFRQIGRLIEFLDEPGVVETALALSGSSAQSKIQTYPGDCDFFERVNILAPSKPEACHILARIVREKALSTLRGPNYQLIQVRFGSYPCAGKHGDYPVRAGSSIPWTVDEVQAGEVSLARENEGALKISWLEAAQDPGWVKLDWVVADTQRGRLANASNMLDVTWESPDGQIVPLDGYLDPYFQEVYLDASSAPIFSKLSQHVSGDALDDYVGQLEREVTKYLTKDVNYGKAAKRMYNIFRLTGKIEEAAYVRELFDEPASLLYQVWSLIRTINDVCEPGSTFSREMLLDQTDKLIVAVVSVMEGGEEAEVVRLLLRLRDGLAAQEVGKALNSAAEAARAQVINLVNNFFYEKLTIVPTIKNYIQEHEKKLP